MKTSSGQTDFSLENLLLGDVSNEKNHKPLFRIYWTQTNKQKNWKQIKWPRKTFFLIREEMLSIFRTIYTVKEVSFRMLNSKHAEDYSET